MSNSNENKHTLIPPDCDFILSLDLEMNQPSERIIEIGAAVVNLRTGAVVESLSALINPQEPLNPFIVSLTGITDYMLQTGGTDLPTGYQKLVDLVNKYPCIRNPLTWGHGDSQLLRSQLPPDTRWLFGHRSFDVKTLYQFIQFKRGVKPQAGLAKAMAKVGLQFHGRKHRATDDAINTGRLAAKLLEAIDGR